MAAYDQYGRLVVLKVVPSNSNELAMIHLLSGHIVQQLNNHTIPILDILHAGECTIIVMPAWELTLRQCIPVTRVKDFILIAIQCLQVNHCHITPAQDTDGYTWIFQGLEYMHKQRIAHLDIYPSNILVNHIANRSKTFLHGFDYQLAYIDFEFSINIGQMAPLVEVHRLPPTYHDIPEVKARRSHVDAFACDVSPQCISLSSMDTITSDLFFFKRCTH
jgi:serine/threonine protein kinase